MSSYKPRNSDIECRRTVCDSLDDKHYIGEVTSTKADDEKIDICCSGFFGSPVIGKSHIQCLQKKHSTNYKVVDQLIPLSATILYTSKNLRAKEEQLWQELYVEHINHTQKGYPFLVFSISAHHAHNCDEPYND